MIPSGRVMRAAASVLLVALAVSGGTAHANEVPASVAVRLHFENRGVTVEGESILYPYRLNLRLERRSLVGLRLIPGRQPPYLRTLTASGSLGTWHPWGDAAQVIVTADDRAIRFLSRSGEYDRRIMIEFDGSGCRAEGAIEKHPGQAALRTVNGPDLITLVPHGTVRCEIVEREPTS